MHETNFPNIRAYIDDFKISGDTAVIRGWALDTDTDVAPYISIRVNDLYNIFPKRVERPDVASIYDKSTQVLCGWEFTLLSGGISQIEFYIQDGTKAWIKLNLKDESKIFGPVAFSLNTAVIPSFTVIDNVYSDPDSVRKFALEQIFVEHKEYHKGCRTDKVFRFPGLKELFESKMGAKIINWDKYGTNGCFQYCIAGDQIVYHYDQQEYAGVLFLTPDAPPNTGSSFYRSKYTHKMKVDSGESSTVFKNGFLDSTEFEMVDTVGNVYNRVVLFDAKLIHSASCYFGTTKENGRLFQLFFFDIDKTKVI
jgi:hypothetical protein